MNKKRKSSSAAASSATAASFAPVTTLLAASQGTPDAYYQRENAAKEEILFPLIRAYYERNADYLETVRQIVEPGVSRAGDESTLTLLRRLDGLAKKPPGAAATHVARRYFIESTMPRNLRGDAIWAEDERRGLVSHNVQHLPFDMVASYYKKLGHYQKRYFDGFRRRTKLVYRMRDGGEFVTSYCQLNFFAWVREFQLLRAVHIPRPIQTTPSAGALSDALVLYDAPQYVRRPKPHAGGGVSLLLDPQVETALMHYLFYIYETQHVQIERAVRPPKSHHLLPSPSSSSLPESLRA